MLYEQLFPEESSIRQAIEQLKPGDKLDITWQQEWGSDWIAHIPWTLVFTAEPPSKGRPVDAMGFLGLRLRIGYRAHKMALLSRALGPREAAVRAHLMYWGGAANDPVSAEADRHRQELADWHPLVLPQNSESRKEELRNFLSDPTPRPVGLMYFYCQCATGSGADPVLRFGSTNGSDDVLEMIDLGTRKLLDQPLIFANACGTAAGDPYTPNQLEQLFFRRKCRAFIGTECRVPTAFAARFATAFFSFLYSDQLGPIAAGEGMAQARRFFLGRIPQHRRPSL